MNAAPQAASPAKGANDYAAASVPAPYRILGLNLKPFCLDHYLLLRRFDCAFVREERGDANHMDLILGVLICSMRPKEFLEFMEADNFIADIEAWGKLVGLYDMKEKALLFQRYLKDGWSEPPHINKKPGSKATGDWAQNVKITLTSRLNYTPEHVGEMPLSQALADYYKLAESDGVIQLLQDEDFSAMENNNKAMENLHKALGRTHGA